MGRGGRRCVAALLPGLRQDLAIDVVIANGENAANGRGITPATAAELFSAGIDVLTGGNHTFDLPEGVAVLEGLRPALRPANYPPGTPGRGLWCGASVTVLNLIGRTFMAPLDDPFQTADRLLANLPPGRPVVVDFHAEATSEKQAMAWHLDGRVAAVVGTHTHVPSADARLLPRGTAMVTDLGMCGARDSIVGSEVEAVLTRMRTGLPTRLPPAERGPYVLNGALIEIDDGAGRARSIERVDRRWDG